MITTIRQCDRCAKEKTNDKDFLWTVAIATGLGLLPQVSFAETSWLHFCRSCMVTLGLLPSCQDDPPAPDPKPTALEIVELLAEKLRELEQ